MANLQVGVAGNGTVTVGAGASVHSPASNILTLGTNNAERLRINSSGQLGINKSSPKAWNTSYTSLQIHDAGYIVGSTDDSFVAIGANNYLDTGGSYDYTNSDFASQLYQVDGTLVFRNAASGTADNAITWLERLKIDSDGTLKMDQAGTNTNVLANDTGGPNIWMKNTSNTDGNYSKIGFFNSTGYITAFIAAQYQDAGDRNTDLVFGTRANGGSLAERLRITSAGDIGIGLDAPSDNLEIRTDANGEGITVKSTGNTSNAFTFDANRSGANNGIGNVYGRWNGTTVAQMSFNSGSDTTDKNDGYIWFGTESAASNGNVNATERMRLDNAGRLIIGHTTSTGQDRIFQVIGTTSDTSAIEIRRHSADASSPKIDFAKSRNATKGSNTIVQDGDNLGQFTWRGDDGTDFTTPAATIFAAVDGTPGANDMPGRLVFSTTADGANSVTERLRITSGGQLLIGTTSVIDHNTWDPAIEVAGLNANTSSIGLTRFGVNASAPTFLFGKSRNGGIGVHSVVADDDILGNIAFIGSDGTDFAEAGWIRCRVDGAPGNNDMPGALLFGTTPDGTQSAVERMRLSSGGILGLNCGGNRTLHVQNNTSGGNIGVCAMENNMAGNSATMFFLSTYRNSSASEYFMQFNRDQDNDGDGAAAVFYVATNGNVKNTNNSYGSISDIKLKENIVDAGSQWNDIKNIKVRNFNFKSHPSEKLLGVVAQEVETVSAGLVEETPDKDITKLGDEGTTTKTVKYSILYMKAVKALQEAMARIETLETKVAALESA